MYPRSTAEKHIQFPMVHITVREVYWSPSSLSPETKGKKQSIDPIWIIVRSILPVPTENLWLKWRGRQGPTEKKRSHSQLFRPLRTGWKKMIQESAKNLHSFVAYSFACLWKLIASIRHDFKRMASGVRCSATNSLILWNINSNCARNVLKNSPIVMKSDAVSVVIARYANAAT